MSDREKLIELIESARYWGSNTSAEIADHLIANGVGFLPCKLDGDRWYIPLSNGQKYCTSYEAKMKEVK